MKIKITKTKIVIGSVITGPLLGFAYLLFLQTFFNNTASDVWYFVPALIIAILSITIFNLNEEFDLKTRRRIAIIFFILTTLLTYGTMFYIRYIIGEALKAVLSSVANAPVLISLHPHQKSI